MQTIKTALAAAFTLILLLALPAAAETVSVPVGNWAGQILDMALAIFAATAAGVVAWLAKTIGGQFGSLLMTARVDQLLVKAAAYGVAVTKSATKDTTYSFEVTNAVVLAAYRYFDEHGGALVTQFAGTKEQIIQKIIARLPVPPEVTITPQTVATLASQA
jgi:hypothetical protein